MRYRISMYKMKPETRNDLQMATAFCGNEKTVFSKKRDARKTGRGNPLLSRKHFSTIEEIDSRLDEFAGAK